MAGITDVGGILGAFSNLATGNSAMGWINIAINIVLSTIVGGIVLLIVMEALSKAWGENVSIGKCFTFVLIISLLLWVGFMKLFFGDLSMAHAAIAGVIGFVLSMFVVPIITGLVLGFLPLAAIGA